MHRSEVEHDEAFGRTKGGWAMAFHRRGGSAWSHRWLWVATIAAGIGVLVATAAAPSSASHARRLAGSPIVTYTFADVNTQGPQYKNIAESARVYGSWINAHGGINGHPLKVKFCDALGTPTGATACARKAVADHAVAVIGSFTFTGDAIVPTLQAAKTAYFGLCCALSPTEFSSPVSFPTGDQPLYAVGLVARAVQDGCTKMVGVIIQGADLRALHDQRGEESREDDHLRQPSRHRSGLQPTGGTGDKRRHGLPVDGGIRDALHRVDGAVLAARALRPDVRPAGQSRREGHCRRTGIGDERRRDLRHVHVA